MPVFGTWQCATDTFQQEERNPGTPEIWENVSNVEGNIKKPNLCMPDLVFHTCFFLFFFFFFTFYLIDLKKKEKPFLNVFHCMTHILIFGVPALPACLSEIQHHFHLHCISHHSSLFLTSQGWCSRNILDAPVYLWKTKDPSPSYSSHRFYCTAIRS